MAPVVQTGKRGELTQDETAIIAGALELTDKTARDAMTPISETFAIVKNELAIHPEDEVLVKNVTVRRIPRVPETSPLYDTLNEFQKGHSHIVVIVKHYRYKTQPACEIQLTENTATISLVSSHVLSFPSLKIRIILNNWIH
ncbi:DUF21 domain-containing protein [Tripterygium wilfordii]|uniref:DUF21 domain-containing protein n=1 Tax=Tripterygium wilfordii TaxID=458696 RepID=A0A7J7CVE4_TRIWF|nr:DUF21 domain-containing protein [Tripterygium wilfordii]